MTMKMSFCLKAATTLHDDDLASITDSIEAYVKAGMPVEQAETAAVDDLMAAVQDERAETVAMLREQHPASFKGASKPVEKPEVKAARRQARVPALRGSDALARISAHLGGLSTTLLPDLSSKVTRTRTSKAGKQTQYTTWDNPLHQGHGPLFRAGGTGDLSEVARVLEEEGYIEQGLGERDPVAASQQAEQIVRAELANADSTLRQGDPAAIEAEMQRRREMADIPDTLFDDFIPEDLAESGYAAADAETKALTEHLLAQAEAQGQDTEAIREDAARGIEDQSEDFYHARLQDALRKAIAGAGEGGQEGNAEAAPGRGEDRGQTAGDQDQETGRSGKGLTDAQRFNRARQLQSQPPSSPIGEADRALLGDVVNGKRSEVVGRLNAGETFDAIQLGFQKDGELTVITHAGLRIASIQGQRSRENVLKALTAGEDAPFLAAQTADDLKTKTEREAKAAAEDRKTQQDLIAKARADAMRGDFTLTGSDREADVAAAAGQKDIFDSNLSESADFESTQLPEVIPAGPVLEQDAAATAKVEAAFRNSLPGLKLTALPRLTKPTEKDSPLAHQRYFAVQLIERLFGKRVIWFSSNVPFANGMQADYVPDAIFISESTTRPLMAVLGHELLHVMRREQPGLYRALGDRLTAMLVEPGGYGQLLNARRRARGLPELGFDKLREELIADIVGDNFTDPIFWRRMQQGQPGLFQRVLSVIRDFLDRLLSKLKNERPYGTAKYLDDIAAARDAVAQAMREFAESPRTTADAGTLGAMSLSQNTDPFYSELARQVEVTPMGGGNAMAWKNFFKGLTNKGSVKADEIAWTGIEDWLDLQPGKVTRAQVLDYLNANGVRVTETVLGEVEKRFDVERMSRSQLIAELDDMRGWSVLEEQPDITDVELREQLLDAAQVAEESMESDDPRSRSTKYSQYTLPGGTNYREVLLTLPGDLNKTPAQLTKEMFPSHEGGFYDLTTEQQKQVVARQQKVNYKSGHWDQPNILAHIRLNDRTDAEGKKVLFVEELQSDYAQAARKGRNDRIKAIMKNEGITKQEAEKRVPEDAGFIGSMIPQNRQWEAVDTLEEGIETRAQAETKMRELEPFLAKHAEPGVEDRLAIIERDDGFVVVQESRSAVSFAPAKMGVPRAPFVGKTEAWVALALKRVIKLAADEGYDRVAFVNGDQSAERYSLSKQVHSIKWEPYSNGTTLVSVFVPDQNALQLAVDKSGKVESARGPGFSGMEGKGLDDIIGKEVAKRILEAQKGELAGEGLNIGGEGMKAFYDKIVPAVAKDVLRKLGGGSVGQVAVQGESKYEKQFKSEAAAEAWAEANLGDHSYRVYGASSASKTFAIYDEFTNKPVPDVAQLTQPGFDITPEMQEKAAGGLPMFSLAPGITPPKESLARAFQRKSQDQFNRFNTVRDWASEHGANMTPESNVWAYEERMHGRIATRIQDFREKRIKPAIQAIQKAGFTMEQVAEYLHAQHAEERNKQIESIDPTTPAGSGMTTVDANAILAAASPKLAALANDLRKITDDTRDVLLKAGIIDQDTVDAWQAVYKNYVPLKGGDADPAGKTGTGKGLNVAGKQKRAMGHSEREESIVENILRDHERAITLAEKNFVGQSLLAFIADLASDDIATIGKPEKRKVLRNATDYEVRDAKGARIGIFDSLAGANAFIGKHSQGLFTGVLTAHPVKGDQQVAFMAMPRLAENEVNVYVGGYAMRVQLNDELLARAYTRSGAEGLNQLMGVNCEINAFLSKAYTGYNPEFLPTNIIRDLTTGVINTTGNFGAGVASRALANYPKAFATLTRHAFTGKETPAIAAYRAAGGSTGASYLSDIERIGKDVQNSYDEYQGVIATLKGRGAVAAGRAAASKFVGSLLGWIEHMNAAGENAMRLSVFEAVRNTPGFNTNDAASAAKNATVNFNRRGEWGQVLGAMYLFFNPAIQGSAAIFDTLMNGKNRYQAWALAGSMGAMAYLAAAMQYGGGDDDDEEWTAIPDNVKDNNLIIRTGKKTYITIPVPYGYGFGFSLGNSIYSLQKGRDKDKVALNVASNLLQHFSPIGNPLGDKPDTRGLAELIPGAVGGELMRNAVRVAVNRSSLGGDIVPDSPFDEDKPDHLRLYRSTKGTIYDKAAAGLNALTGGTKATAGGLDVSPETLKYWVRVVTGGAGAFVSDAVGLGGLAVRYAKTADKEEQEALKPSLREIPIVRRFVKEETVQNRRKLFWDAVGEVRQAKADMRRARQLDDDVGKQNVEQQRGELTAMAKYTDRRLKAIKAKRDAVDEAMADTTTTLAKKRAQVKALEEEESNMYAEYVREFTQARTAANKERAKASATR